MRPSQDQAQAWSALVPALWANAVISEAEIQKAVDFIRDNAIKHAEAKAQRVSLEEHRKIKKARLMQQAEQDGFSSAAMQEREAYAHPDYEELIEGLAVAVEKETYYQAMIKAAEIKIDA